MKKFVKKFFFLILSGGGVALFIHLLLDTGIENIKNSLLSFSVTGFLLFTLVGVAMFLLYTLRWNIVLRYHEGIKVPFYKLLWFRLTAHAMNYLTPTAQIGGEPIRIYFLQKNGVKTSHAISSIIIDKAIELSSFVIFIASGFVVGALLGFLPQDFKELLIGIVVIFLLIIFWFYYSTVSKRGFFTSIFQMLRLDKVKKFDAMRAKFVIIEEHLAHFHSGHLHKFAIIAFISFLTLCLMMLEHFLAAYFLGVNLTFAQVFMATTIPTISYIIPVPGAIGILEGTHAMMFALLGVDINVIAFVLIFRIRDLIFILLGLMHGSKESLRHVVQKV